MSESTPSFPHIQINGEDVNLSKYLIDTTKPTITKTFSDRSTIILGYIPDADISIIPSTDQQVHLSITGEPTAVNALQIKAPDDSRQLRIDHDAHVSQVDTPRSQASLALNWSGKHVVSSGNSAMISGEGTLSITVGFSQPRTQLTLQVPKWTEITYHDGLGAVLSVGDIAGDVNLILTHDSSAQVVSAQNLRIWSDAASRVTAEHIYGGEVNLDLRGSGHVSIGGGTIHRIVAKLAQDGVIIAKCDLIRQAELIMGEDATGHIEVGHVAESAVRKQPSQRGEIITY